MEGILLVDKPSGWTSFDVVNYVRKIVAQAEGKKPKNVKAGHTGTLDPFATGLLVLLIGKDYTRRAGEFAKLDKAYEAAVRFGEVSSTGDPEGEIMPVFAPSEPSREALEAAAATFIGEIEQIPPAYSAVKVDGRRAYQLARAGKEVVLGPRKVTIHRLTITGYTYPEATLLVDVSSGTYIRTLAEDLGKALGTGAYTAGLRRTRVGDFSIDRSVGIKGLTAEELQKNLLV